ncbi:MAG: hypothetical protein ACE5F9_09350 [Phycisphaerae bacterium]
MNGGSVGVALGLGVVFVVVCAAAFAIYALVKRRSYSGVAGVVLVLFFGGAVLLALLLPLLMAVPSSPGPRATAVAVSGSETTAGASGKAPHVSRQTVVTVRSRPSHRAVPGALSDTLRGRRLGQLIAAATMGGLLVLAYVFLDAGARRRYTWPLRAGTAVVFLAICALLWRFGPLM